MCVPLQIKELKTENDELKDDMNKRDLEVQHLKEKVRRCVVHKHILSHYHGKCVISLWDQCYIPQFELEVITLVLITNHHSN